MGSLDIYDADKVTALLALHETVEIGWTNSRLCLHILEEHRQYLIIKYFSTLEGYPISMINNFRIKKLNVRDETILDIQDIELPDDSKLICSSTDILSAFKRVKNLKINEEKRNMDNLLSAQQLIDLGVSKLSWFKYGKDKVFNIDEVLNSDVTDFKICYYRLHDIDSWGSVEGDFKNNYKLIKFKSGMFTKVGGIGKSEVIKIIDRNKRLRAANRFTRTKAIMQ